MGGAGTRYLVIDAADHEKWTGAAEEFIAVPLSKLPPVDTGEVYDIIRPYAGDALPRSRSEIQAYCAILITGSGRSAYDDLPWVNALAEMVREVLAQSTTRLFGFCFGHQIIAHALGGVVGKRPSSYILGSETIEPSHELWISKIGSEPRHLLEAHGDEVIRLPPAAQVRLPTSSNHLTCHNKETSSLPLRCRS